MEFETWLKDEDVQRLWDVCHGVLPESFASTDEIEEFKRVVTHAAMKKVAGNDYLQHNLH